MPMLIIMKILILLLLNMINDSYGNYIIQRLLDICNYEQKKHKLIVSILQNVPNLQHLKYGKYIISKIQHVLNNNGNNNNNNYQATRTRCSNRCNNNNLI